MENWDGVAFKALLRTTSQRLGQLQERNDAKGKLTRRDVATDLSHGQLVFARAKAATLIQEDVMGDLLEELGMMVGVVGRYIGELGPGGGRMIGLESKPPRSLPSPVLVEAVASIIHAAPSVESRDLNAVRDVLIQRLGPGFAQTTSLTRSNHVSPRIMQILSSPPPTASEMDAYLVDVAQTHGVKWAPEPRREDLLDVISEILHTDAGSPPIVDLPRLREICARGLPDHPPWVRPRIWRLLFGTLPVLKSTWAKNNQNQRDSYYDLVRRLLAPLASLPPPTVPLSSNDTLLAHISDSLFRVSPDSFVSLENEPTRSAKCPLDTTAPDTIRISCASNLDQRLSLLKGNSDTCETPEIRLETDLHDSDPASPLPPPSPSGTTLLPSKAHNVLPAHHAHVSALLRLLYVHSTLNPAVQSPHIPWLLVPLYSALVGETNEDDVAHAEADTFWVFEVLVGEIAELEEEEGRKIWTHKLSERVRWADGELATSLHTTGLDPVLPHYSYRWLAPLLAQTLPLSSIFPVWDVLFACPMRTRDANPKLDYLVDICAALLIRARTPLFRLGKPGRNVPGLWTRDHRTLPPPSALHPWELSDAFTEGVSLLTSYPIDAAGGIDRILQTASDLAQKRIKAKDREKGWERGNVGFRARITQQMWKGFTNQIANGGPEEEEEEEEEEYEKEEKKEDDETGEHDDGNDTETPAAPTLTSRLANTVWRGITNQSSMDDEMPSPPSPSSAQESPTPPEEHVETLTAPPQASLWNYAGKLQDSDTIAAFTKVSTNWRAKALDAWGVHKVSLGSVSPATPAPPVPPSTAKEVPPRQSVWPGLASLSQRRGSLPGTQRESEHANLDPPRPAFFRSPRESFLHQPRREYSTAPSSPIIHPISPSPRDSDNESNTSSFIQRASTSLVSLASFSSHSTPKNVPRPLLLNSREFITNKSSQHQSHLSSQWGDVATKHRHALRQESVSSMSSLSPSEAMNKSPHPFSGAYARSARSDNESDGSASRRIPLNRKSVSPMALASRSPNVPWNVSSPAVGHSPGHPLSNGSITAENMGTTSQRTSTTPSMGFDSPTMIASSPIPQTPLMSAHLGPGVVRIVSTGHVMTSSISTLSEASEVNSAALEAPTQSRLFVRKKTPPPPSPPPLPTLDGRDTHGEMLSSSESGSELPLDRTPSGKVSVKLRSKRYVPMRPGLRSVGVSDQRTPSLGWRSLMAECPGEYELAATPRMESCSGGIGEGDAEESVESVVVPRPLYVHKTSKEARLRRVLSTGRDGRQMRDSGAEEGDDEGYDELLSAYESEEGGRE